MRDRLPDRPLVGSPLPAPARPVLLTGNSGLRNDLLPLCAAAGVEPQVLRDVGAARSAWNAAPLVLVGVDLAAPAVQAGLTRRPGVVLVGLDLDEAGVWDVAVELGAESVVFLPDATAWLIDRLADAVEDGATGFAVSVVGGRGGAGATTFAAGLAVTAARERLRCMLVDADPLGGGIDLALGGEDAAGMRWAGLPAGGGRLSSSALSAALPEISRVTVLSYGRGASEAAAPDAMRSVLRAARRATDVVVVDVPRRLDPAAELAVADADVTLLVVPAEVRAAAAASRVAAAIAPIATDLRLVVRGPAPTGVTALAIADALALPLVAYVEAEPRVAEAADRGEPPARHGRGPLAGFCRDLLAELALLQLPAA